MEMKLNLCTEELEDMIAKVLRKELPVAFGKFFGLNRESENQLSELVKETASCILNKSEGNSSSNDIDSTIPDETEENSNHILAVIKEELEKVHERCGFFPKEFPQIVDHLRNHVGGK